MSRARYVRVHRGSVTMEVEADIDLDDVLDEISDETLRRECTARGIVTGAASEERREAWLDMADDIRAAARHGEWAHLEVLFLRMQQMAGMDRLRLPPTRQSPGAEERH